MLRESFSVPVADADLIIAILEQHFVEPNDDDVKEALAWFDGSIFRPMKACIGDSDDDRRAWMAAQTIRKALTDKPDDMNDAIERLNEMGYDTVGVYFTKSKSSWGCCAAGDTEHVDDWIDEDGYPTPREAVMAVLKEAEKEK